MSKSNLFKSFINHSYYEFGPNPAKMLIYTGVLGWFLSSAAQVSAIMFNKDIPKEAKWFLVPQEIGDGAINVLSFFAITSSIKAIASRLVSTGKIATPAIRKFLSENELTVKKGVGKVTLNIEELSNFSDIAEKYTPFKNGVDVAAMTLGSILSCNIVTPLLRNRIAGERQAKLLRKREELNKTPEFKAPRGISMAEYQYMSSRKFSTGGGLKI